MKAPLVHPGFHPSRRRQSGSSGWGRHL